MAATIEHCKPDDTAKYHKQDLHAGGESFSNLSPATVNIHHPCRGSY